MNTYLQAVRSNTQTVNPLFRFLGITLLEAAHGQAVLSLPVSTNLQQGNSVVAGGIIATLADEAMAHAVISTLKENEHCVTAEMNIRYLRSASIATTETITAKASVIKRGRQVIVCTADIFDTANQLLASSGSTFYIASTDKQA